VEFTDLSYFEPAVWFWNFGDGGAISQEINPVHTYAAPGTYQVCLTVCNANACDSECMEVEVKTVGTISVHGEDGEISLSPNPASDIMHVQFEAGFHGRIVISDLAGSSVQTHFISEESRSIEVPVNQLENGAYVLTFFDASGKLPSSVKFMVLR
jgi:PKD repeat protein